MGEATVVDDPTNRRGRPASPVPPRLTSRQVTILAYLAEGRDIVDIAHRLGYSPSTIKKDVHLLLRRCGARSRAQAVALGIRWGII